MMSNETPARSWPQGRRIAVDPDVALVDVSSLVAASYLPARRAARLEPGAALR